MRHCTAAVLLIAILAPGCATLQEVANLRNVQFDLDALTNLRVAGVDVSGVRSYGDLGALDVVRIGAAVGRNELPVSFTLDVLANNPPENGVQARMVSMDWTLLLEDRETVSGVFQDEIAIPAGETRLIPITVELDLIRFFDGGARDLVDVALSLVGQGGEPKNVKLRAVPTIQTPLGPLRYPEPVTIVNRSVG